MAHQTLQRTLPYSLPNLLTYGRIAAAPALAFSLYFLPGTAGHWLAFGIFVVAAVTDWLDGYLARAWDQQSSLGRLLDPIADKLLVGAALLMLVADQTIAGLHVFAAIIILSREILVSGLREFLADLNASHLVHVTQLAKWKTAVQMVALAVLIAGPAGDALFIGANSQAIADTPVHSTGLLLLWIAALLTLFTGYDYLVAGVRYLLANEPGANE